MSQSQPPFIRLRSIEEVPEGTFKRFLIEAKERLRRTEPFRSVLNWIDPPAVVGTPAPAPSPDSTGWAG